MHHIRQFLNLSRAQDPPLNREYVDDEREGHPVMARIGAHDNTSALEVINETQPGGPRIDGDLRLRLPLELLILITSMVWQKGDILTLCRVSRAFNAICTPLLYQGVALNPSMTPAKFAARSRLYRKLQETAISHLVTDLRVTLEGEKPCDNKLTRLTFRKDPAYGCSRSCGGHDGALGKALVSLIRLELLTIDCMLCHNSHSHEYLYRLELPLLRHFKFRCFGSLQRPKESLFLAPFMSHVTSLTLECNDMLIYPRGESHEEAVNRADVAPNLHTLSYDGRPPFRPLLLNRPIQRICLQSFSSRIMARNVYQLDKMIRQSPGQLTHLLAVDLLQWLSDIMTWSDPGPYLHLRFVGTITLFNSEDHKAFSELNRLRQLCNLELMEINHLRRDFGPSIAGSDLDPHALFIPTHQFFALLGGQYPLLRRILFSFRHIYHFESHYIDIVKPVLWSKAGDGSWSPRPVPHLDYWDIVCDKLDKF